MVSIFLTIFHKSIVFWGNVALDNLTKSDFCSA